MSLTIFRAEVGELRADVVGLGQVQLSVLGESPQPVSAGLATSAIEVHRKSNAVVGTGLLVPIADVLGSGERRLVIGLSAPVLSGSVGGPPRSFSAATSRPRWPIWHAIASACRWWSKACS